EGSAEGLSPRMCKRRTEMKFASRHLLLTATLLAAAALVSDAAAQTSPPNFSVDAWLAAGGEFKEIPGAMPKPVGQDPRYRYVPNNTGEQPTYRIGDITNPNLKQWVRDAMK